jgi:hypothetical protein
LLFRFLKKPKIKNKLSKGMGRIRIPLEVASYPFEEWLTTILAFEGVVSHPKEVVWVVQSLRLGVRRWL